MILPFDTVGSPLAALVTTVRAALIRRTIARIAPDIPMAEGCPYLTPYMYVDGKDTRLYLLNASFDDYAEADIRLPEEPAGTEIMVVNGEWHAADASYDGGLLKIKAAFDSMNGVLLKITAR